ncbi:hypothetical protein EGW08_014546 [Elysia chlorotica]|uniref:Uncharacterized protein n=1 Tax=Elysia chlorotica TaxID=188477 RepID=A0A433T7V5_ELYCH|nr:hypothetical protein EGW08_014546 [Elysia chlorotica]
MYKIILSRDCVHGIDRGRLPHPCGIKVKKICRHLPRPPAQSALKRGVANRQLPSLSGRGQYTPRSKRRGSGNKPHPQRNNTETSTKTNNNSLEQGLIVLPNFTSNARDETQASAFGEEDPRGVSSGRSEAELESASEGNLGAESDSDMEARRRRRLLERVARVSSEDAALTTTGGSATSWRAKVYSEEGGGPRRRSTDWSRRSSRDSADLGSLHDSAAGARDSREIDEPVLGEFPRRRSSRRQSDGSSCSENISERLARRRAARLEEAGGDSSSLDSSFDSPRTQREQRRHSRGERDTHSTSADGGQQNGHQGVGDDGFEDSRRKSRSAPVEGDKTSAAKAPAAAVSKASAWRDPTQRSRGESVMSLDSNDPAEGDEEDDGQSEEMRSLRRRRKLRRRQSEDSNTSGGQSRETRAGGGRGEEGSDSGGRRGRARQAMGWADPQHSLPSTESCASFRSCGDWSSSGHWTSRDSRTFSEDAPHDPGMDAWSHSNSIDNNNISTPSSSSNNNNNNHQSSQNGGPCSSRSSCDEIYSLAPSSIQPENNNNNVCSGQDSHTDQAPHITDSQTGQRSADAEGEIQEVPPFYPKETKEKSDNVIANGSNGPNNRKQSADQNAFSNQHQSEIQTEPCGDAGKVVIPPASGSNLADLSTPSSNGSEPVSGTKVRRKKVRRDKSALRKSPLNMASHPPEEGKKM